MRQSKDAILKVIQKLPYEDLYCEILRHKAYGKVYRELRTLIRDGADAAFADAEGNTPLHVLASIDLQSPNTFEKFMDLLISCGADVNARNVHGKTPLQLAALRDDMPIVLTFIRYGADASSLVDHQWNADRRRQANQRNCLHRPHEWWMFKSMNGLLKLADGQLRDEISSQAKAMRLK